MNRSVVPRPADSGNDVNAAAADGLPKRFGKYTLLRKLAQGGMAELFLALQKSVAGFEKLIVIKRILPAMNSDKAFIDMLLHEARIAATLSHPNIVQIFDVGQVDGTYFIAMEHVHGEDIRSIVRQMKKKGYPTFPREHALGIVMGMCAGLAYAHERADLDGSQLNIVHRDISPQNVVVTFSGDVKIVDFGIAKSDNKGIDQTKSGKLKGKVPYMSPEQARGDNIDARSDVFATGVMLFELTTGRRLFKGASEYETLKLICDREYPRPSQVVANYPPALERIVMRALEKDRDERYQSARDMQHDLELFIREERVAVSTVALNEFMQGLFEEKLASQKEALLQGKALAEIIDAQASEPPPPNSGNSELDLAGRSSQQSILSMPAASRTVTEADANRPTKSALPWIIAAVVLVGAVGAGGGFLYLKHKKDVLASQQQIATPPPPPPIPHGSIAIDSDPPGASIWINGDLRAEVTPTKISDLPIGSAIDVKLTKDGFEQAKENVTLTTDNLDAKISEKMLAGSVSVDVTVLPAIAAKTAVLLLDGKKIDGHAATGLSSGNQHAVVVSSPGFIDQSVTFLGSPQESKHLDVTLQKEPPHKAHPISTGTSTTVAPPSGSGKLNVGASGGWCNVSVDGKGQGATPVAGVDLPAGPHKVTCTTADGKVQSASVNVAPNDTTRYRFSL